MKASKFILKQHWFTKQWRWQVKAANGKIIGASTESYFNRGDCLQNAINLELALANAKI